MKQPNSPLPWVAFNDNRGISDKEGSVMMNTIDKDYDFAIQDNKDIEYIVEACNNYPKAIEFLKRFKNHCNNYSDWPSKSFKEQMMQFLKSIE